MGAAPRPPVHRRAVSRRRPQPPSRPLVRARSRRRVSPCRRRRGSARSLRTKRRRRSTCRRRSHRWSSCTRGRRWRRCCRCAVGARGSPRPDRPDTATRRTRARVPRRTGSTRTDPIRRRTSPPRPPRCTSRSAASGGRPRRASSASGTRPGPDSSDLPRPVERAADPALCERVAARAPVVAILARETWMGARIAGRGRARGAVGRERPAVAPRRTVAARAAVGGAGFVGGAARGEPERQRDERAGRPPLTLDHRAIAHDHSSSSLPATPSAARTIGAARRLTGTLAPLRRSTVPPSAASNASTASRRTSAPRFARRNP